MTPDPYQGNSGGPGDPSNPESWNHYAYVVGNPVNLIDPSGLTTCDANGNNCYDSVTVNGSTGQVTWWSGPPSGADDYAGKTPPWFQDGGTKSQYMQQILAWQNCYKAVQQQQAAPYNNAIQVLDNALIPALSTVAVVGGIAGAILGSTIDELAGVLGTYGGSLLGAALLPLALNEIHTDAVVLLTVLSNLPPSAQAVTAACGPKPGN
jgi:hypothetical protein